MKKNFGLISLMLIASTVILISSCNHTKNEEEIAEVNLKLQEADKQKDYQHLQMLADSLGKTGDLQEGESNYWQAYAYYRMKHRRSAEFFWKEAMNATGNIRNAILRMRPISTSSGLVISSSRP